MSKLQGNEVMNGSWGEVWIDGDYMAEIMAFSAKLELTYEPINIPRQLGEDQKLLGTKGVGTLKFYKVNSRFHRIISDNLRAGKQTSVLIISKLDDPDAFGAERIAVKNATFNDLTLANWEAKKIGEEETSFNFRDHEPLDLIG